MVTFLTVPGKTTLSNISENEMVFKSQGYKCCLIHDFSNRFGRPILLLILFGAGEDVKSEVKRQRNALFFPTQKP